MVQSFARKQTTKARQSLVARRELEQQAAHAVDTLLLAQVHRTASANDFAAAVEHGRVGENVLQLEREKKAAEAANNVDHATALPEKVEALKAHARELKSGSSSHGARTTKLKEYFAGL